jgi:hypothetical protein
VSATAALRPGLDPEAGSLVGKLPIYAYAEVSYVRRVSEGLELGARITAQVNSAELVQPPKGLPAPEPGARPAESDLARRDPPALPTPISPFVGATIFGRFDAL